MNKKKRKGIWIPQSILDLDLSGNDKILLAEIFSLCELEDGCFASNTYFKRLIGFKTAAAVSKRISFLVEKGLIRTENIYKNKQCIGRLIYKNEHMEKLDAMIPNNNDGTDIRNEGVFPNEPKGNSNRNTINSLTNSININTNTSINTGENIVQYQNISKSSGISMSQFYKNQRDTSAEFLINATKIGANIFLYDSSSKFNTLENLIGKDDFYKVKPELLKFIEAKNKLG